MDLDELLRMQELLLFTIQACMPEDVQLSLGIKNEDNEYVIKSHKEGGGVYAR